MSPDDVLSPEEGARLVQGAEPGQYRTFFLTALLTGMRVGELTALTWDDVDFDGAAITVRRTVSWARPRGEEGKPQPRFL